MRIFPLDITLTTSRPTALKLDLHLGGFGVCNTRWLWNNLNTESSEDRYASGKFRWSARHLPVLGTLQWRNSIAHCVPLVPMVTKGLPPIQRVLEFLRHRLLGQQLVGIDRAGNKFYSWHEKNDIGEQIEKRRVKVPGSDILYDPRTLTPEWRAWLTKTRAAAPTEEELQRAEERAAAMKARVAAIEQREAKRRFRAAHLGKEDSGGPDLKSFTSQLEGRGFGGGDKAPHSGATGSPRAGTAGASGSNNSGDGGSGPSGSGEAFKPGVWKPGQE